MSEIILFLLHNLH